MKLSISNYFDAMQYSPRGAVAYEMYSKLMERGRELPLGRNEYYEEAGKVLAEYERLESLEKGSVIL
jgi:hypothetical protein